MWILLSNLQINDQIGTILTKIGGIESDVKGLNARMTSKDAENVRLCERVEKVERTVDNLITERKTVALIAGSVSAGIYLIIRVLSYLNGGGSPP
jgi:hypothetical protein